MGSTISELGKEDDTLNIFIESSLSNIKNLGQNLLLIKDNDFITSPINNKVMHEMIMSIGNLFNGVGVRQIRNRPSRLNNEINRALSIINKSLHLDKNETIINALLDHYYYNEFGCRNVKFINIVLITSLSNIYFLNCKYSNDLYSIDGTELIPYCQKLNVPLHPAFIKLIDKIDYYDPAIILNTNNYNYDDKSKNVTNSYSLLLKLINVLIKANKEYHSSFITKHKVNDIVNNKLSLYVLLLEQNKYYIGTTGRTIDERFCEHSNNNGSEWTKKYKPIKVIQTIPSVDKYDEDKYTKMYMDKYGRDNVRGGSYCKIILSAEEHKILDQEQRTSNNKCFNCGGNHYAKDCNKLRICDYCQKALPANLEEWKTYHRDCYAIICNKSIINDNNNQGKKWSKKDENELMELYKNRFSIAELAEMFGRTERAIEARLEKLNII